MDVSECFRRRGEEACWTTLLERADLPYVGGSESGVDSFTERSYYFRCHSRNES